MNIHRYEHATEMKRKVFHLSKSIKKKQIKEFSHPRTCIVLFGASPDRKLGGKNAVFVPSRTSGICPHILFCHGMTGNVWVRCTTFRVTFVGPLHFRPGGWRTSMNPESFPNEKKKKYMKLISMAYFVHDIGFAFNSWMLKCLDITIRIFVRWINIGPFVWNVP